MNQANCFLVAMVTNKGYVNEAKGHIKPFCSILTYEPHMKLKRYLPNFMSFFTRKTEYWMLFMGTRLDLPSLNFGWHRKTYLWKHKYLIVCMAKSSYYYLWSVDANLVGCPCVYPSHTEYAPVAHDYLWMDNDSLSGLDGNFKVLMPRAEGK